jgi:UDP-N-acetylglucosamine 2-epimerase (non-hydrolysing)
MRKQKVILVIGTRPDAVKMIPVLLALKESNVFETVLVSTGQHREILSQVLESFLVIPDYDLNVMQPNQELSYLTTEIISRFEVVIKAVIPSLVLVHGDTATAFSCALTAFYNKIPVVHIEAGLRTYDKYSPFPEEINRMLLASIASIHFAPTIGARDNLIQERIEPSQIFVTGNTVVDALAHILRNIRVSQIERNILQLSNHEKFIILTVHRRENIGSNLVNIFDAIRYVANEHPDVLFVFPVHPNPKVKLKANELLMDIPNVKIIQPLPYAHFVYLMSKCYAILTDSCGIQEEAPNLGKPVLLLRDQSERNESIHSKNTRLVGSKAINIIRELEDIITSKTMYQEMTIPFNLFGDGSAAQRIRSVLENVYAKEFNYVQ